MKRLHAVVKTLRNIRLALLELCLLLGLLPLGLTLVLQQDVACKYWLGRALNSVSGLTVADISGNAMQGLKFTQLRYQQKGLKITLEQALLTLDINALWQAQLEARQLQADGLAIIITNNPDEQPTSTTLPEISLPFTVGLQQLLLHNAVLQVDNWQLPFQYLHVTATLHKNFLTLDKLRAQSGNIHLQLDGHIQFSNNWPVNARSQLQMQLPANIATMVHGKQASGSAQLSGSIAQLHIHQQLAQPLSITGDIHLQPLQPVLHFALQQQWQPALLTVNQQRYQLGQGTIALSGLLDDYTGNINTSIQVEKWPAIAISLAAQGNLDALNIHTLDAHTLDASHGNNRVQLQGQVAWLPTLAWQIQGKAQQLNPALLRQDFLGELNFDFNSKGNWGTQPEVQVNIDKLNGTLRGYPLSGYSHLALQGDFNSKNGFANSTFSSDTQLDIANNRITLHGSTGQQLDINLKIEGEHLASLLPDLAGKLALDAHLGGSRQQPLLSASLQADNLRYRQWSLGKLALSMSAEDPDDIAMQLDVEGSALHNGPQLWLSHFSLNGAGLLAEHALHWQMENPHASLAGALQGEADIQGNWHIQLQQLLLDSKIGGHWILQNITDIQWQQEQLNTETACLAESALNALLCVHAQGNRHNGQASVTLQEVPLAALATLLDEPVAITGTVNASASAQIINDELQAQLDVDGGTGYMAWLDKSPDNSANTIPKHTDTPASEKENYRINWHRAKLEATLQNRQLHSQCQLLLDNGDNLTGQLDGEMQGNYPLTGKLALQLGSLQWLELLLPVQHVQGLLAGQINIGGTVSHPQITGNMALQQGRLLLPDAGIKLNDIVITATAGNNGIIEVQGSVTPGSETATPDNTSKSKSKSQNTNGKLLVNGTINTQAALPWPVDLHLQGQDVQVLDRNDALVKVNPDLQVSLSSERIKVRGKVTVNQAELKPRELPKQAIKVSADTRRVDIAESSSTWQLDNDITIVLGDKVTMQGFGLDARFTGDVRLQQQPQQPLSLSGVIHIIDGRYKIYGQNLKVERGNLLFQGPADNPGLDILAVRVITANNVRVGLEIGGTLQHSRSTVFSDPAMEESEAMAWLLTGRPLSGASQNDGNAILQAIAVYGIDQGDFISQRVGKTLGIDVGFDTEGVNDQAAFMLGKQLSTRVYIRYSVGLFETISTVMLRYSLSQNVSLETRTSGQTQSVDLLYRKER